MGRECENCRRRAPVLNSISRNIFRRNAAKAKNETGLAPQFSILLLRWDAECEICRELCMALTVASRHYVPKALVRLHKRHLFSLLLKEGASVGGGR